MLCRVKTLIIMCVVGLFLSISSQSSQNPADDVILSSYPGWIYQIMTFFPKWSSPLEISADCKLSFSSTKLEPEKCRLQTQLNFFDQIKSKIFFDFDISDAKQFQKINLEFPGQIKIRGLLALHSDQIRPLVIFRMGIHGNRDEVLAERYLLKILFADLGLHVLMIENLTSHAFLTQNKNVSIGGFEEALHTFFLVNLVKSGLFDWSRYVSDLHLVGISLGGPGVMLATSLDEKNKKYVKSSMALCPLINLKENFDDLNKPGWFNTFVDFWNWRRMLGFHRFIPEFSALEAFLKMTLDQKPRFMPKAMSVLNENASQPLLTLEDFNTVFPEVVFSAGFKDHVRNSNSLFELNQFWPLFENETTPIQIVSTPNDPLVKNYLNSDLIRNHQQPGHFLKTNFLDLEGVHCALASEYQWPFLVEVVRRGLGIEKTH